MDETLSAVPNTLPIVVCEGNPDCERGDSKDIAAGAASVLGYQQP